MRSQIFVSTAVFTTIKFVMGKLSSPWYTLIRYIILNMMDNSRPITRVKLINTADVEVHFYGPRLYRGQCLRDLYSNPGLSTI